MAAPVNDYYGALSGQPIYGGRFASSGQTITPSKGAIVLAGFVPDVQSFHVNFTISTPAILSGGYGVVQRNGAGTSLTGDIAISGTYTGTIASGSIEASFNGGAFQTIVVSPSGGTFNGTLSSQPVGMGSLTVRCTAAHASTATISTVFLGDVYGIWGDSNHVGRAVVAVQPVASNGFTPLVWYYNGTWGAHVESATVGAGLYNLTGNIYNGGDSDGQGSYFGALATLIMAAGCPCAFVPAALGGTSVDNWHDSSHSSGNSFNQNFLLDTLGVRIRDAMGISGLNIAPVKAALCELGTNSASGAGTRSLYAAALQQEVDDFFNHHGTKSVCYLCHADSGVAHLGTQDCIAATSNALVGPDFTSPSFGGHSWSPSDIHYGLTSGTAAQEIQACANVTFAALQALGFYA